MLEKAETLHRGRISTSVIKAIFAANNEDQINAAMRQLEGKQVKTNPCIARNKTEKKTLHLNYLSPL